MSTVTKIKAKFPVVKSGETTLRQRIVRQDRIPLLGNGATLVVGGLDLQIADISPFGIRTISEGGSSKFVPESIHSNAQLLICGYDFGEFKLRVVRTIPSESGIETAFEVLSDIFPIDEIKAAIWATDQISLHNNESTRNNTIPNEFKLRVLEAKQWLSSLEAQLSGPSGASSATKHLSPSEENAITQVISKYISTAFPAFYKSLEPIFGALDEHTRKICIDYFRHTLKDLIYQAPFADRVFNKPRGYAGDFEMMNIIYRGTGEGASLFAKCLHRYWIEEPSAQAVRNRANYLIKKLKKLIEESSKSRLKILTVASGPAREIVELLESSHADLKGKEIDFYLLDQDEDALKFAQAHLLKTIKRLQLPNIRVHFLNKKLQYLLVRGAEETFDIIYSAGLFDYFSDAVAQHAARKLFEGVSDGGHLIIGNFNVGNPNLLIMNLALDWHLIYRSEKDLIELLAQNSATNTVEKEDLDINLFFVAQKS